MNSYDELVREAIEESRVHERWTRHGGPNGPERYVTVNEEDYAALLYAVLFVPCAECGRIKINVRHDLDGDRSIPRHAFALPAPSDKPR